MRRTKKKDASGEYSEIVFFFPAVGSQKRHCCVCLRQTVYGKPNNDKSTVMYNTPNFFPGQCVIGDRNGAGLPPISPRDVFRSLSSDSLRPTYIRDGTKGEFKVRFGRKHLSHVSYRSKITCPTKRAETQMLPIIRFSKISMWIKHCVVVTTPYSRPGNWGSILGTSPCQPSRSPPGEDKLVMALLLGAAKVKQQRRGDKRHRHEAGLQKNGGRKQPTTVLRPLAY